MEDYLFPLILAHDYEAFRAVMQDDFPDTHQGLLDLVKKRKMEESQRGFNLKEIYVEPHEFMRFCRATRQGHNWASLGRFVAEKEGGNQY